MPGPANKALTDFLVSQGRPRSQALRIARLMPDIEAGLEGGDVFEKLLAALSLPPLPANTKHIRRLAAIEHLQRAKPSDPQTTPAERERIAMLLARTFQRAQNDAPIGFKVGKNARINAALSVTWGHHRPKPKPET